MAEKQNCERMSEENFRKLLIPSPLTLEDVKVIINSDPKISANLPTRYYKNPITGCVIASCDKRDFRPNTLFDDKGKPKCPICLGDTTQIIFFEPIGNNASSSITWQSALVPTSFSNCKPEPNEKYRNRKK